MKKENENYSLTSKKPNALIICVLIVLVLYALSLIFILGWGFLTSLKTTAEYKFRPAHLGGPNLWGLPDVGFSKDYAQAMGMNYGIFSNYINIISKFGYKTNKVEYYSMFGTIEHSAYQVGFVNFVVNSTLYAVVGSGLYMITCMVSGYLCSKYKFKFSSFLYAMLLIIMTIPLVGTQPATIKMLRSAGLYDTYASMLIMNMNFCGLYFFVFYAYFQGVSDTYYEAAEIDGASQARILVNIMVPLSTKIMLTVFIIQFIALWNNYEAPMLYYPSKPTLAYAVYQMANNTTNTDNIGPDFQDFPQRVAGCMILAVPLLILFIALKDVIMGNLTLGGLKE